MNWRGVSEQLRRSTQRGAARTASDVSEDWDAAAGPSHGEGREPCAGRTPEADNNVPCDKAAGMNAITPSRSGSTGLSCELSRHPPEKQQRQTRSMLHAANDGLQNTSTQGGF